MATPEPAPLVSPAPQSTNEAKPREKAKITEWVSSLAQAFGVLVAIAVGLVAFCTGIIDAKRSELEAKRSELNSANIKAESDLNDKKKELMAQEANLQKTRTEYATLKKRLEPLELEDQAYRTLGSLFDTHRVSVYYRTDHKLQVDVQFFLTTTAPTASMFEPIKQANNLRNLKGLSSIALHLSNGELALTTQRDIVTLDLTNADLTSHRLSVLQPKGSLKMLKVPQNQITSFAEMPRLASVDSLDVGYNPLDDNGVASVVERFPNVANLLLNDTSISDVGLAHLSKMRNLRFLSLSNTKVSDDGIAHLAGMQTLTALRLSKTKITINGLGRLAKCRSLLTVELEKAQATNDLIAAVQRTGATYRITTPPEFRFRNSFPSWEDFVR